MERTSGFSIHAHVLRSFALVKGVRARCCSSVAVSTAATTAGTGTATTAAVAEVTAEVGAVVAAAAAAAVAARQKTCSGSPVRTDTTNKATAATSAPLLAKTKTDMDRKDATIPAHQPPTHRPTHPQLTQSNPTQPLPTQPLPAANPRGKSP